MDNSVVKVEFLELDDVMRVYSFIHVSINGVVIKIDISLYSLDLYFLIPSSSVQ